MKTLKLFQKKLVSAPSTYSTFVGYTEDGAYKYDELDISSELSQLDQVVTSAYRPASSYDVTVADWRIRYERGMRYGYINYADMSMGDKLKYDGAVIAITERINAPA